MQDVDRAFWRRLVDDFGDDGRQLNNIFDRLHTNKVKGKHWSWDLHFDECRKLEGDFALVAEEILDESASMRDIWQFFEQPKPPSMNFRFLNEAS